MDIRALVEAKARAACGAKTALALTPTRLRNEALLQMGRGLEEKARPILEANRADLDRARARGHPRAFLDRLTLTDGRIEEMAQGLRQIAALPDPLGETVDVWRRPNGLEISRVRVPLGVIGFVYESRPNVTADAAGLCLKSGNAVVLRGGSEATESNALIAAVLAKSIEKVGAPADAIQFIENPDRAAVLALLEMDRYLDLIIPRGGEAFVRLVAERARVDREATQLELEFFEITRRGGNNAAPRGGRAGKRHLADVRMFGNALPGGVTVAGHNVHHAVRNTDLLHELADPQC